MRKTVTHLYEGTRSQRLKQPLTAMPTCCWHSHLRAMLHCFDDPPVRIKTRSTFSQQYRSRFYYSTASSSSSSSSCAAAVAVSPSLPPTPSSRSLFAPIDKPILTRSNDIPQIASSRSSSPSSPPSPPSSSPSSGVSLPPGQLYGPLAIFNFTDHITLSDLEQALEQQQAERAWQLFSTLTLIRSRPCPDRVNSTTTAMTEHVSLSPLSTILDSETDLGEEKREEEPIVCERQPQDIEWLESIKVPYHHCTELYALLLYAQDLATHSNVIAMRQQQLNKVAAYVQEELGLSKEAFIDSVPRRPVPTYKRLQQALQHNHRVAAWKYYAQLLEEDPNARVSRNHYLKLLALIMAAERRYLKAHEQQAMIDHITAQHADIPCEHGRRLPRQGIEWIAKIFSEYDQQEFRKGRRLVKAFLTPQYQALHTPDTIDELVWRLTPYDLRMANDILRIMNTRGLPQNESTYLNLIKANVDHGRYEKALMVFERILTFGSPPSIRVFNAVLRVFSEQCETDRVTYIWDTLHALDLTPDAATYSEMIRCFGRGGHLKPCLHYYDLMVQQQQRQLQQKPPPAADDLIAPNLYTFSVLIESYGQHNDVKGVLHWFQIMLQQGLAPNEVIVTNILKALGKHHRQPNMMEAVHRIAQQCMMAGVKADTTLYTLLLTLQSAAAMADKHMKNSSKQEHNLAFVLRTHREMLARCVEPNVYTYTALIGLCGRHGYFDTAQRIFDLMQQSEHHQPTTVTYHTLLEVWRSHHQQERVDLLLSDFLVKCKSNGLNGNRLWVDAKLKHQFRCYHGC